MLSTASFATVIEGIKLYSSALLHIQPSLTLTSANKAGGVFSFLQLQGYLF